MVAAKFTLAEDLSASQLIDTQGTQTRGVMQGSYFRTVHLVEPWLISEATVGLCISTAVDMPELDEHLFPFLLPERRF